MPWELYKDLENNGRVCRRLVTEKKTKKKSKPKPKPRRKKK